MRVTLNRLLPVALQSSTPAKFCDTCSQVTTDNLNFVGDLRVKVRPRVAVVLAERVLDGNVRRLADQLLAQGFQLFTIQLLKGVGIWIPKVQVVIAVFVELRRANVQGLFWGANVWSNTTLVLSPTWPADWPYFVLVKDFKMW